MAQQTAMQEAIKYLKSFNLEASAIILEDKFLEKEKEQIINACVKFGNNNGVDIDDYEEYYNETYNK